MAGGFILNIFAATEPLKEKLESLKNDGNLPHVTVVRFAHPGKDIEKGKLSLSDGTLYVYPSGSGITDVAGRHKVVKMTASNALTFCVDMKRPDDADAINKVGETIFSLVSQLGDVKFKSTPNGNTETTLTSLVIDKETRELHKDGFYFYSIRVLTAVTIKKIGE